MRPLMGMRDTPTHNRTARSQHLKQFGTAEDGRLFRAAQSGRIRSTEYTAVRQRAREKALTPAELDLSTRGGPLLAQARDRLEILARRWPVRPGQRRDTGDPG
ncbi:hypothetical protein HOK021_73930 [Streptomyces hygroscopicus]|nr:hypothetical protein HOK021_73930 [Streptomyces hygroscopicus]